MARNDAADIAARAAAGLQRPTAARGVAGLIPNKPGMAIDEARMLPIKDVTPNPHQARQVFSEQKLGELAESIREQGVLEPIIVRPKGDGFEVVAGERRLRAVRRLRESDPENARWTLIPAIIRNLDDEATTILTAVENIQREDLTITDEAAMYERLVEVWGLRPGRASREIARRLGISHDRVGRARRIGAHPGLAADVDAGLITLREALASLREPTEPGEPHLLRAELDAAESLTHGASNSRSLSPAETEDAESLTHGASNSNVTGARHASVWRPLHLAHRNVSRVSERIKAADVAKLPADELPTLLRTVDQSIEQLAYLKALLEAAEARK